MARGPEPDNPKMAHDSLVTVRLSEPESLILDSTISSPETQISQSTPTKDQSRTISVATTVESSTLDAESVHSQDQDDTEDEAKDTKSAGEAESIETPRDSAIIMPPPILTIRTLQDELTDDGHLSDDQEEVNWEQLQKTEDEQHKDEETDNVSRCTLAQSLHILTAS